MSDCVRDPYEDFMSNLRGCDTVTVGLKGIGETKYTTEEVYNMIDFRVNPPNDVLDVEQMNHLDHEPIYIQHLSGGWRMNGWHIATASSYQNHGRCDLEIDNGPEMIDMQNYGITWVAYRRKP